MTDSTLFLIGLAVSIITGFGIVVYLRTPLLSMLVELCGTRERATFWLAFSNVTVILVPVIFAMQCAPELKPGATAIPELVRQLKWALAGLLSAVFVIGWVLSRFIRRHPVAAGAPPSQATM